MAGNDSNDGLSDLTPKRTLAASITATGGAARVLLACTGGAWSNVSMVLSAAITVDAYSPKSCKEGCRLKKPILAETRAGQTALTLSSGSGYAVRNVSLKGGGTGQTGISSAASSVEVDQVDIDGFATSGFACTAGTGVVLKRSTLTNNTEGAVAGCVARIEGNRFDNNSSAYCLANPGTCATKHALRLVGAFGGNGTVGLVAQHNEFSRTGNLAGGRCATPVIVAHGRHKGLTIEDNTVTETNPTTACWGISLEDGFASGAGIEGFVATTIRSNTVANVGGVGIGVSSCQNCYVDNNVVVRNSELGSTAAADDFVAIKAPGKVTGSGDLVSDTLWVRNNSIYLGAATASSKAIQITQGMNHGINSNLIELAASHAAAQCFDDTGLTSGDIASIDYNLCHRNGGAAKWKQDLADIAAARASGRDKHGTAAAPLLLDEPRRATRWSMAVNQGSPAINTGDASRATRIAYQGHPRVGLVRDIGAAEFEALGKTYFVSNSGSNSNNGLSVGSPFQTIAFAKNMVNPGDTIEIRAGTYNESLLISRPGTPTARITMRGYNGERPILRGDQHRADAVFLHAGLRGCGRSGAERQHGLHADVLDGQRSGDPRQRHRGQRRQRGEDRHAQGAPAGKPAVLFLRRRGEAGAHGQRRRGHRQRDLAGCGHHADQRERAGRRQRGNRPHPHRRQLRARHHVHRHVLQGQLPQRRLREPTSSPTSATTP